jgi:hypothetical protein
MKHIQNIAVSYYVQKSTHANSWVHEVAPYIYTELLGFWTFSIVWYSREHDVSVTGSVSVLR